MLKNFAFSGGIALAFALATPAAASQCTIDLNGTGCAVVTKDQKRSRPASRLQQPLRGGPSIDIGATIPRGEYSILLNAEYYGLGPVSNGWVYMQIEGEVFRVDFSSHEVLENVTHKTAANW